MDEILPNIQSASVNFLERDFNQCFEQIRYYDSQIVNIFKHLITFYTTIAGISIGLFQFKLSVRMVICSRYTKYIFT